MFSSVWNSLFPARCLLCSGGDAVTEGVCLSCRSQIRVVPEPLCDVCGKPIGTAGTCLECRLHPPAYDRCLSACLYEGLARDVIRGFKYRRETAYRRFLAGLIHEAVSRQGVSADILTFVPLHWSGMIARGYNQSALIARELSSYLHTDVRYGVLKKTRRTPNQVGLSRKDRERNLRQAFTAGKVEGKSVMVVDDVVTTGGTAQSISRTLKDAGARRVIFVSVGRSVS